MNYLKTGFFFFFLFFSFSSWSSYYLNWSGWSRLEAYYQKKESTEYYGLYQFVLNPKLQILEHLTLHSRFDLKTAGQAKWEEPLSFYNQRGLALVWSETQLEQNWSSLFLNLSQLYLDYESDFLALRVGRAPYHFGLGDVYSAEQNPFHHWMSVYNQVSLYLEFSQFYFQPTFLNDKKQNRLLTQFGFHSDFWNLEGFYQYDFDEYSLIHFYGKYVRSNWELKSSFSYFVTENLGGAFALEALMDLPQPVFFQLEFKMGGAFGSFAFHPNYDVALLFWNRYDKENKVSDSLKVAEEQIQEGLYFSPRFLFSFLNESLKIKPVVLFAYSLEDKNFHYEFDVQTFYQIEEHLFFSLVGAFLYSEGKPYFGLLGQATVSF